LGQEYPYKKHKRGVVHPCCAWLLVWAVAFC
jgi:hypothetical protein